MSSLLSLSISFPFGTETVLYFSVFSPRHKSSQIYLSIHLLILSWNDDNHSIIQCEKLQEFH